MKYGSGERACWRLQPGLNKSWPQRFCQPLKNKIRQLSGTRPPAKWWLQAFKETVFPPLLPPTGIKILSITFPRYSNPITGFVLVISSCGRQQVGALSYLYLPSTVCPTELNLQFLCSCIHLLSASMSFSAALIINNKQYSVRRFTWGIQQNTDAVGRPDARVQGGQLQVELDSEPDETLHHWALDDTKKINGEVVVFSADNRLSRRKTIRFEEAYCVGLGKQFDGSSSSEQGMTMTLTLSANRLSSGEVKLDNKWPA